MTASVSESVASPVSESYDGSNAVFRVLCDSTWGPELMNLGHYRYRGPFAFLNMFVNLSDMQTQLALRSIKLMNVQPGDELLDLACGRGRTTYMMRRIYRDVTALGVDLLPENIRVAEALYGNVPGLSYRVGDATNLVFAASESVDAVHCLEAAFHFPDRNAFVAEAARVLRPGGRFALVDFMWRDEDAREQRNSEAGKMVRKIWQWDDNFTADNYCAVAAEQGLSLVRKADWSRQVSQPMQGMMNAIAWLCRREWGRRMTCRQTPMLNGLTDADWAEFDRATAAHKIMTPLSRYTALTFVKGRAG